MPDSIQQLVLWLIPLAPLAAAVVTAALGPKWLRQRSHLPCWFGLAVAAVCSFVLLLSIVPERFGDHGGTPAVAAGYQWIDVGGMNVRVDLRADAMTAMMLAMVTSVSLLVAVFAAGYMHGDPGLPAVLRRSVAVRVFDVHAGAGRQLPAAVCVLGRRRPVQLPADRLLVPAAERGRGGQEGVCRQPHRRLWISAGHLSDLDDVRLARLRRRAAQSARAGDRSRPRSRAGSR